MTKSETTKKGMETIIAILVVTQKTIPIILSSINKDAMSGNPEEMQEIDKNYINIRNEIKDLQRSLRDESSCINIVNMLALVV